MKVISLSLSTVRITHCSIISQTSIIPLLFDYLTLLTIAISDSAGSKLDKNKYKVKIEKKLKNNPNATKWCVSPSDKQQIDQ